MNGRVFVFIPGKEVIADGFREKNSWLEP